MLKPSLAKFLIYRIIRICTLLFAICWLSFWLISYSPDPVQAYVGADMMLVGPEQREKIADYWGLNKSPLEQFFHWGSAVIQGDLDTSMIYRKPVVDIIGEKFSASLALIGIAWLLSGLIGFALGVIAAMKQGTWVDRLIKWYCLTLASTPTFWLGLLLLIVFAVWLKCFPIDLGVPDSCLV